MNKKQLFSAFALLFFASLAFAQEDVISYEEEDENDAGNPQDIILSFSEAFALDLTKQENVDEYVKSVVFSQELECEYKETSETCSYNGEKIYEAVYGDTTIRSYYKEGTLVFQDEMTEEEGSVTYFVDGEPKPEEFPSEEPMGDGEGFPILNQESASQSTALNRSLMDPEPTKGPLTVIFDFLFGWLK